MRLKIGKLYSSELENFCLQHLPLADELGGHRLDFSTVLGKTNLCIATDPVIGVPLETYGYFAVHYSSGDLACSGVTPEFLNLGIYMPPDTSSDWLASTCKQLGEEARNHGIKILGGHTGVYQGLNHPLISTTSIGFRKPNDPIPQQAHKGDKILLTGSYGFEFLWALSHHSPERLRDVISSTELKTVKHNLKVLDVITPSRLAWANGAHFVHDITEGGLSAALLDLSRIHKLSPIVNTSSIPWHHQSRTLIEQIEGDLLSTSSFGSILIVTPPASATKLLQAFASQEIPIAAIGYFKDSDIPMYTGDEESTPISLGVDPYTHIF